MLEGRQRDREMHCFIKRKREVKKEKGKEHARREKEGQRGKEIEKYIVI